MHRSVNKESAALGHLGKILLACRCFLMQMDMCCARRLATVNILGVVKSFHA